MAISERASERVLSCDRSHKRPSCGTMTSASVLFDCIKPGSASGLFDVIMPPTNPIEKNT